MKKPQNIEQALIKVVMHYDLKEQFQIQEKLREQGIELPQSTLSRWLKKLHIVKFENRYQILNKETLTRIPVLSIKVSFPNLMVLHTLPGHANSLAYQIDQKTPKGEVEKDDPYAGVLGTIAGDDTVLIIMEDKENLIRFKKDFEANEESFYILY